MVRADPCCYGRPSLSAILELREECLREFDFTDAYQVAKARENDAAMTVLPGLLNELEEARSRSEEMLPHLLLEGLLAGNVFDWGAKACVQLYEDGSILDIYKASQKNLSKPYAVDDSAAFVRAWHRQRAWMRTGGGRPAPWRRAIIFADNAGADVVLGVLPFCRALLGIGVEVVLCANRLPAINDITADEIRRDILPRAGLCADVFSHAYEKGVRLRDENGGRVPMAREWLADYPPPLYVVDNGSGSPCLDLRRVPVDLSECAKHADLVVIEGMGRSVHTNFDAKLKCDVLKIALLKNLRLAQRLLGEEVGKMFSCVVKFEEREQQQQQQQSKVQQSGGD
ncbi:damage-control phosphatase [Pycnococcus provasolii]